MSAVIIPQILYNWKLFIKMLSIRLMLLPLIRVGLLIQGKQFELNMLSKNCLTVPFVLHFNKSRLKSPEIIISYLFWS